MTLFHRFIDNKIGEWLFSRLLSEKIKLFIFQKLIKHELTLKASLTAIEFNAMTVLSDQWK